MSRCETDPGPGLQSNSTNYQWDILPQTNIDVEDHFLGKPGFPDLSSVWPRVTGNLSNSGHAPCCCLKACLKSAKQKPIEELLRITLWFATERPAWSKWVP